MAEWCSLVRLLMESDVPPFVTNPYYKPSRSRRACAQWTRLLNAPSRRTVSSPKPAKDNTIPEWVSGRARCDTWRAVHTAAQVTALESEQCALFLAVERASLPIVKQLVRSQRLIWPDTACACTAGLCTSGGACKGIVR